MKGKYKQAYPYADDAMNLPVEDVDTATPFYETIMGFTVVSRSEKSPKTVVLARDDIQMAIVENGKDPTQEGCFFEVEDVEAAFAELRANGFNRADPEFSTETYEGGYTYKVFFVLAPDGLCYCIGQLENS